MYFLFPILLFFFIGIGYLVWRRFLRASYATWPLFYQMLMKWTVITLICGGYSFFLGLIVSNFRFMPMIAAMVVTAAVLAFIESRAVTGKIKARFPMLKRAMTYGTRFRIFWAFMILLSQAIMAMFSPFVKMSFGYLLMLPQLADFWIGLFVTELFKIIGFNIHRFSGGVAPALGQAAPPTTSEWINQLGIFGISLTTAAIHVMILGAITLLIWAALSTFQTLRQKKTS